MSNTNQPQPPKDGMLPVGELRQQILGAINSLDWTQAEFGVIPSDDDFVDALLPLFTTATNEKLAGGGDTEAIIQEMLLQYTAWVNGEPVAWNVKKAEAIAALNTAKQTAVAEEKSRLVGLLPKPPVFNYAGTNPNGGIYATYDDAYKAGEAKAITEMRNVLEGK